VHDALIVEVTSSPPVNSAGCFAAKNVVDLESESFFYSAWPFDYGVLRDFLEELNNWICYDFRHRLVRPTSYVICTNPAGSICGHLKSWALQFSLDGGPDEWDEADRRLQSHALNTPGITQAFDIESPTVGQYVKLRNIGKNHSGNDSLCISAFELFGELFEGQIGRWPAGERPKHVRVTATPRQPSPESEKNVLLFENQEVCFSSEAHYAICGHPTNERLSHKCDMDVPRTTDTRNEIRYDFGHRYIVPTHCEVRWASCPAGGPALKSYVFEGSSDDRNWDQLLQGTRSPALQKGQEDGVPEIFDLLQ
jgi:hypothetical protein